MPSRTIALARKESHLRAAILLALLLISAVATAQVDPDVDQMGFYFDEGATVVCADFPLEVRSSTYLCLTNPSAASGVSGWEAWVLVESAAAIVPPTYLLRGSAMGFITPPNFWIGLSSPLPWAPVIVLMEIEVIPLEDGPVQFLLGPTDPSSFGGVPGYAAGDDIADLRACGYSTGAPGVCAVANGGPDCGVVSGQNETWGGVKALYR